MSGCDGWGWKLEDAHDSQAHGVEGEVEHMFWFVNWILWALVQEKGQWVSVCVYARTYCPAQHCFQRVKALGANKETQL